MGSNLARRLIADHLVAGEMRPGEEIALKIDQFRRMTSAALRRNKLATPADASTAYSLAADYVLPRA